MGITEVEGVGWGMIEAMKVTNRGFTQHQKRFGAGFTLIELLVVIAIIGLLSSIVLASLNSARAKARDAKRVSDIQALKTAVELYYLDNNQYPPGCASSNGANVAGWSTLLSSKYIGSMPKDPSDAVGAYGYYYCQGYKRTNNCADPWYYSGMTSDYMFGTRLEGSHPQACASGTSGWDNPAINYIVAGASYP